MSLHTPRMQQEILQLKKAGWGFLIMACLCTLVVFFLPEDPSNYWLSHEGKLGFYVLSSLFAFFGFYCLGATWRRKNFTYLG